MLAYKFLAMLWPFIKEWFLGSMSVREALKHNKKRLISIAVFMIMVIIITNTVPKLYTVSRDYLALKKEYDSKCIPALEMVAKHIHESVDISKPVVLTPQPYVPTTKEDVVNRYGADTKEPGVASNGSFNNKKQVTDNKQNKSTKATSNAQDPNTERYRTTKEEFERIKKLEESNGQ